MFEDNPLLTLCVAASILERQEASASQNQSVTVEETRRKSNGVEIVRKLKETYQANIKFEAKVDFKPYLPKIPNNLIAEYAENTSDELRKRFSFKCIFSPKMCSEVVESYGSELKAFSEMKRHIWSCHILGDSIADLTNRKPNISTNDKMLKPLDKTLKFSSKSSKKSCSGRALKIVSKEGSSKGKSILQELTKMEENYQASLDTHFKVDGKFFSGTTDTLKFGQIEHDYAKLEPSTGNPPIHETGQNKNQRGKFDIAYNRRLLCELERHINGDSYLMPPIVPTAPFPFVHEPVPPEPAMAVELYSNGNPVDFVEPVFVQSSVRKISSKKVPENKTCRKKTKFSRMFNGPRSVLECVENRVAGKLNASSEEKDALVPYNSIENSENVEKSIHDIAWRNIQILSQQRRKRKYRDKPSVYVCEICNKHFTANTSLTYHYLGHLKIKPFKCHICYRTFTRRHSLKYHMMIHANKNRFQCSTCKRLFRHPSHYKEHLRKHTGEEPYSCKFCSNKFKTRNSFKRHLKMQHQKLLTSNGIVSIRDDKN